MHKNLKDSKVGRGLNVIALDGRTFEMKISDTFDTYLEGKEEKSDETKRKQKRSFVFRRV